MQDIPINSIEANNVVNNFVSCRMVLYVFQRTISGVTRLSLLEDTSQAAPPLCTGNRPTDAPTTSTLQELRVGGISKVTLFAVRA